MISEAYLDKAFRSTRMHFQPNDDDDIVLVEERDPNEKDYTQFVLRTGYIIATQPVTVVQSLIQVGYEPFHPVEGVTMFGRKCLKLPSGLSCMKYIYRVDGFGGLFRGLAPRMLHDGLRYVVATKANTFLKTTGPFVNTSKLDANKDVDPVNTGGQSMWEYIKKEVRYLVAQVVGSSVSFPFQVIGLRMIAEFVGRETAHRRLGIFGALQLIYQDHGILGFFNGLAPLVVGQVTYAIIYGVIEFTIIKQIKISEGRICLSFPVAMIVSSIIYPFVVVSNTMTVVGSRLRMGQPPCMPNYKHWVDCWRHLKSTNSLFRGANLFYRSYTGRCDIVNGKSIPIDCHFGPNHLLFLR